MMLFKTIACIAAAVIALPSLAIAQGASKEAPGREQKKPGQAKQYAPGQQERSSNKDKKPGAKEYAPGHETKK